MYVSKTFLAWRSLNINLRLLIACLYEVLHVKYLLVYSCRGNTAYIHQYLLQPNQAVTSQVTRKSFIRIYWNVQEKVFDKLKPNSAVATNSFKNCWKTSASSWWAWCVDVREGRGYHHWVPFPHFVTMLTLLCPLSQHTTYHNALLILLSTIHYIHYMYFVQFHFPLSEHSGHCTALSIIWTISKLYF